MVVHCGNSNFLLRNTDPPCSVTTTEIVCENERKTTIGGGGKVGFLSFMSFNLSHFVRGKFSLLFGPKTPVPCRVCMTCLVTLRFATYCLILRLLDGLDHKQ